MNEPGDNLPRECCNGFGIRLVLLCMSIATLIACMVFEPPLFITTIGIILASSITTVTIVTPLTALLARKTGAIDLPGGRRIHESPTPRLGGIPIATGVIVALVLTSMHFMPNLQALLTAGLIILVAGTLDDIRGLKAPVKLLIQVIACAVVISDGIQVTFLPPSWGQAGVVGEWLITAFWIIGITNAVNFLDGMDGLVSGLSAVASAIFFALAMLLGQEMLAYCAAAIFGASLAFLSFNFRPAKIFLGDSGSTFLGFFLATMSVQGDWAEGKPLVSFFIPILIMSVPIYDMVFTTVNRIMTGKVKSFREWLEFTGTDHMHHRLEALGLSRAEVVVTIWFLSMGIGLGAIALFEARSIYGGLALILQAVCVYMILALLESLGAAKRG